MPSPELRLDVGPGGPISIGDGRTGLAQLRNELHGGRLADVVGLRLEGEAPEGDVLPMTPSSALSTSWPRNSASAPRSRSTASAMRERHVVLAAECGERLHVLREARAAVAGAGEQELRADARVGADALAHRLDVGAESLAELARARS